MDRAEAILEEVREQYRVLKEGLDNLQHLPAAVEQLQTDVTELKTGVKMVKSVVRQHSADITELKAAT